MQPVEPQQQDFTPIDPQPVMPPNADQLQNQWQGIEQAPEQEFLPIDQQPLPQQDFSHIGTPIPPQDSTPFQNTGNLQQMPGNNPVFQGVSLGDNMENINSLPDLEQPITPQNIEIGDQNFLVCYPEGDGQQAVANPQAQSAQAFGQTTSVPFPGNQAQQQFSGQPFNPLDQQPMGEMGNLNEIRQDANSDSLAKMAKSMERSTARRKKKFLWAAIIGIIVNIVLAIIFFTNYEAISTWVKSL